MLCNRRLMPTLGNDGNEVFGLNSKPNRVGATALALAHHSATPKHISTRHYESCCRVSNLLKVFKCKNLFCISYIEYIHRLHLSFLQYAPLLLKFCMPTGSSFCPHLKWNKFLEPFELLEINLKLNKSCQFIK